MTDKNEFPIRLILLGTEGCHLCDDAEIIIAEALGKWQEPINVEKIDISEQEQWQDQYAVRIPVLLHPESRQELSWPFDLNTLKQFLYRLYRLQ